MIDMHKETFGKRIKKLKEKIDKINEETGSNKTFMKTYKKEVDEMDSN